MASKELVQRIAIKYAFSVQNFICFVAAVVFYQLAFQKFQKKDAVYQSNGKFQRQVKKLFLFGSVVI
jgi:hypothetical protein